MFSSYGLASDLRRRSSQFGLWLLLLVSPVLLYLAPLVGAAASSQTTSTSGARLDVIGSLGGLIKAVAVEGTYAYAGEGTTLLTLDISNKVKLTPLGRILLPDTVSQLKVLNHIAYLADGNGGLQIIDVQDPANPVLRGSYQTGAPISGVEIANNLAYVVDGQKLSVIDVSQPSNPTLRSSYPIASSIRVHIVGQLAYITAGSNGLQIIDISDPTNPILRAVYNPGDVMNDVQVIGTQAYIALGAPSVPRNYSDMYGGLAIIDVHDLHQIVALGRYSLSYGSAENLVVIGNSVYLSGSNLAIQVIDISHPTNLVLQTTYPATAPDLELFGTTIIFAGQRIVGLLDISNITHPTLQGEYIGAGIVQDVRIQGSLIYIGGDTGLQIADNVDPARAHIVTNQVAIPWTANVRVLGNIAYANGYNYPVELFDTTDPSHPSLVSSYKSTHGSFTSMDMFGRYLYIGELGTGLQIVDVSNPALPMLVGVQAIDGSGPQATAVQGQYAYVAAGNMGLIVVDIHDPRHPQAVASVPNMWASGIAIEGNRAYIADSEDMKVFDISNPTKPLLLSSFITQGSPLSIQVVHGRAFLAEYVKGLEVVDVTDSMHPTSLAFLPLPGGPHNLDISGDTIVVADAEAGLKILRFTDTSSPMPTVTMTKELTATATPKSTVTATSGQKTTATPKPTSLPKATATPKPTSLPKATATPKPTNQPRATAAIP